ncbi:hypothetical protein TNCV_2744951 [Trichonephila clavipes]|nr:hypothetical protein TNCV_2744951 [Trichonephila clavipes]
MGSKPGEDMDVCKCVVTFRHGCTLNSRRAASPLVWLVEGEERCNGPVFTCVDDNIHHQTVNPTNKFLESEGIRRID